MTFDMGGKSIIPWCNIGQVPECGQDLLIVHKFLILFRPNLEIASPPLLRAFVQIAFALAEHSKGRIAKQLPDFQFKKPYIADQVSLLKLNQNLLLATEVCIPMTALLKASACC